MLLGALAGVKSAPDGPGGVLSGGVTGALEGSARPPSILRRMRPPETEPTPDPALFDAVVNLCKRRGFVFPSAEIYRGIRSTYDYGPLGALMLRNVREAWWRSMVQERDDIVPIDAAVG